MKITTILFDFVGVLLCRDPSAAPDPLVEAIDARIGSVTDDEVFRRQAFQDFSLNSDQFREILDRVVDRYIPYEPLWDLLPWLRCNFRLGIINNGTWLTYPRFNQRLGLMEQFDVFISSAVEGVRKPHPGIYLQACQKLGVAPEECLFMDDAEPNVAGAVQVGMGAIHWPSQETGFRQFGCQLKALTGLDISSHRPIENRKNPT